MKLVYRYRLLIAVLFMFPSIAEAQVLVSETDFSGLKSASDDPVALGTTHPDYSGWEFVSCYKVSEGGLTVGNSGCLGGFTIPQLKLNGNASIVFEVKKIESATIVTSITGGGTLLSVASRAIDKSTYYHIAFYVKDGTPSTRLTITCTAGVFNVKNMKVYNIGDAIFYESFSNMKGDSRGQYYYDSKSSATIELCDNSQETSLADILQSEGNIYIDKVSSSYQIYSLPIENSMDVLLSFRLSQYNFSLQTNSLSLQCSSAKMTNFNSNNIAQLNNSWSKTMTTGPYHEWQPFFVIIKDMGNSDILTFQGRNINIDEIKVTPIPINLDQYRNNDTYIFANAAQTRDVQLIRTLTPNIWCPLCLPFDVTKEKMEDTTGKTCELCILNSIDNGVFKFDIATSTIPAGTPFLVRVAETVTNPEFKEVTIVNTPAATATASTENYQFVGTYSPVDLETDGTNLFLATDGALYKPTTDGNRLGGLRAYFVVPATSGAGARVMIPEIVSDIRSPRDVTPATKYEIYDLRGQRVSSPYSKGVFIHNGKRLLVP